MRFLIVFCIKPSAAILQGDLSSLWRSQHSPSSPHFSLQTAATAAATIAARSVQGSMGVVMATWGGGCSTTLPRDFTKLPPFLGHTLMLYYLPFGPNHTTFGLKLGDLAFTLVQKVESLFLVLGIWSPTLKNNSYSTCRLEQTTTQASIYKQTTQRQLSTLHQTK